MVMIRNDERRGLQAVDQIVRARELPVGAWLVPHAIEPDAADLAVIRKELAELGVHVVEVAVEIAARGTA